MRLALAALIAALVSCGSSGGGNDAAAPADSADRVDRADTVDTVDTAAGDLGGGDSAAADVPDAGTGDPDAGETGGGDAGTPDASRGLGPVQCRTTDDCPSQQQPPTAGGCFASRPGGTCTRCEVRNACPSGTQCIPDLLDGMICARPCTGDGDCNVGMFCNLQGFCAQRDCVSAPCPAPYLCQDPQKLCVRPRCDGDAGASCPAPLVCHATGLCVEP